MKNKHQPPKKYKGKFTIKSTRAAWWDYSAEAFYFITITTKNHRHFFGEIRNGFVCLNAMGQIAYNEWLHTFTIGQDMNLFQGEFIIMPNHMHAIIGIGPNRYNEGSTSPKEKKKLPFIPPKKNISSIVRGYKSAVTKRCRQVDQEFCWLSRFHDRIITDKQGLRVVSRYIINNPLAWKGRKKGRL